MPWRLFPPRQGDYGQRMRTESIAYEVTGQRYVGYAAYPDRANGAGVLIAGEGTGLGTQVKERAHALAELGYAAFALDYIGEGRVLTEVPAMVARLTALRADLDHVRALGRAGLAQLISCSSVDESRIAAIGYCFGGQLALELARDGANLACTVAFHAGLAARDQQGAMNIRGKVLACIGADDPLVPPEQRLAFEAEMRAGNVDWQLHVYGGAKHGFANPNADASGIAAVAYHPVSHQRSWRNMLALFGETIG
jgi:dienelactone hydrolase